MPSIEETLPAKQSNTQALAIAPPWLVRTTGALLALLFAYGGAVSLYRLGTAEDTHAFAWVALWCFGMVGFSLTLVWARTPKPWLITGAAVGAIGFTVFAMASGAWNLIQR